MHAAQGCEGCRTDEPFPIEFTMAFHPIVDVSTGAIWAYEALVRGLNGQGAGAVLSAVTDENRYKFDQACRVKAIELAGTKMPRGSTAKLSINFMPNAVYEPSACIRSSFAAAARVKFDPRRLMFEFTEAERMDTAHVSNIVAAYKKMGFTTAIDDFGAGYSGLGLLVEFQPDVIKIDMDLVRGIATSRARQAVIGGIMAMARELDLTVLAEGVETADELEVLRAGGIRLFQGYYFAKPELETFRTAGELPRLAA